MTNRSARRRSRGSPSTSLSRKRRCSGFSARLRSRERHRDDDCRRYRLRDVDYRRYTDGGGLPLRNRNGLRAAVEDFAWLEKGVRFSSGYVRRGWGDTHTCDDSTGVNGALGARYLVKDLNPPRLVVCLALPVRAAYFCHHRTARQASENTVPRRGILRCQRFQVLPHRRSKAMIGTKRDILRAVRHRDGYPAQGNERAVADGGDGGAVERIAGGAGRGGAVGEGVGACGVLHP